MSEKDKDRLRQIFNNHVRFSKARDSIYFKSRLEMLERALESQEEPLVTDLLELVLILDAEIKRLSVDYERSLGESLNPVPRLFKRPGGEY